MFERFFATKPPYPRTREDIADCVDLNNFEVGDLKKLAPEGAYQAFELSADKIAEKRREGMVRYMDLPPNEFVSKVIRGPHACPHMLLCSANSGEDRLTLLKYLDLRKVEGAMSPDMEKTEAFFRGVVERMHFLTKLYIIDSVRRMAKGRRDSGFRTVAFDRFMIEKGELIKMIQAHQAVYDNTSPEDERRKISGEIFGAIEELNLENFNQLYYRNICFPFARLIFLDELEMEPVLIRCAADKNNWKP